MYVNGKMRPLETIPGVGEVDKGEGGDEGSEFKYDIFNIL
jgi:hypothetical protein